MRELILAMTGASGAAYAVRLLQTLMTTDCVVHLLISPSGAAVLKQELDLKIDLNRFDPRCLLDVPSNATGTGGTESSQVLSEPDAAASGRLVYHHHGDFLAPVASGSFLTSGMVICPCSMGTLAGVAHGFGNNLILRAAAVQLKEQRKLILVPRETPLDAIQLQNMQRLAQTGAVILPAMPGFYHAPKSIDDLVNFVVARICDQLGIETCLIRRWGQDGT